LIPELDALATLPARPGASRFPGGNMKNLGWRGLVLCAGLALFACGGSSDNSGTMTPSYQGSVAPHRLTYSNGTVIELAPGAPPVLGFNVQRSRSQAIRIDSSGNIHGNARWFDNLEGEAEHSLYRSVI